MANCESSDFLSGTRDGLKSLSYCKTVPKIYTQEEGTLTEDNVYQPDQESCKDIPVGGEVVVTTDTETSISAVISSSLQAVNGDCDTEFDGPVEELDDGAVCGIDDNCELADSHSSLGESWAEPCEEFCIESNKQSTSTHQQEFSIKNNEQVVSTHKQGCPNSLSPSGEDIVTEAAGDSNGSAASDAVSGTVCSTEAEKGCCDLVHGNPQSSEVSNNVCNTLMHNMVHAVCKHTTYVLH